MILWFCDSRPCTLSPLNVSLLFYLRALGHSPAGQRIFSVFSKPQLAVQPPFCSSCFIWRTSILLSIIEGLKTMMEKCQGCFFLILLTEFLFSENPNVKQRYDNSQGSPQSKTGPDVFSLLSDVKQNWSLCRKPLNSCATSSQTKKRFRWVMELKNPQTANTFELFDSCGCWLVVRLMWFMTNFCSSRLACIIWCSHMRDRPSSHVTPAPSSPLWTLLRSAFPKQTSHRGERQRNDAAPRCWSRGAIGGGPFGH